MTSKYTIQRVSQQTGLTIDTLRYYEKIGIVMPIDRAESGHRQYSETDLKWIGFIQNLLATGMSLKAVREYMVLAKLGDATVQQRVERLDAHGRVLEAQIHALQGALSVVRHKVTHHVDIQAAWQRELTSSTKHE